jgi:hypothetical protein
MTSATDQIEARLALDILASRAGKRRNRQQARRHLLRSALCTFGDARRALRFEATFEAVAGLPGGVELADDWELWVLPFNFHKGVAPLVARKIRLPLIPTLVRDTAGIKRGPDFAMQALGWILGDDAELERAIEVIESTTELVQSAHEVSQKARKTKRGR